METPKNIEIYGRFFSEGKFTGKLLRSARKIGVKAVYYALVLYYALFSKSMPGKDRKIILGALGYLILPLDLMPDFLPAIGFTDDVAALTIAVCRVMKNITPEVKAQARAKLESLFGNVDEAEISFPDPKADVDEQ